MMRLSSFVKHGNLLVKDESVEDTAKDLAVYCILFICFLRYLKKVNTPKEKYVEGTGTLTPGPSQESPNIVIKKPAPDHP
jgi:hypothetical protein